VVSGRAWRAGLLAGAVVLAAGRARADIIDEDEPTVQPKPTVDAGAAPTTPPAASDGSTKSGATTPPKPAPTTAPGKPKTPPTAGPGQAVIPPKNPGKPRAPRNNNEPVHFESKNLKGLRNKGTVELVQNVVVTQGTTRLEADHAMVYYDEAAKDVVRVVANGNVRMSGIDENSGQKVRAFGDEVIYMNKERTVVLDGNARLWRGDDSVIRSKKITYEMDTGWIVTDRVEGELTPQEKDR
jgi:lipopolysaccharide transport protein LptA